jgi:hypothetical protein
MTPLRWSSAPPWPSRRGLAALPRHALPAPLTLEELDLFLAERRDEAITWT